MKGHSIKLTILLSKITVIKISRYFSIHNGLPPNKSIIRLKYHNLKMSLINLTYQILY